MLDQVEPGEIAQGVEWAPRTLHAAGAEWRYWETGTGDPLVIFHGGGGVDLAPAYAALGSNARVLYFELPGFGTTPIDPARTSFAEVAELMAEVLAAAGLERFALLGISFGGAVAAWLAARVPERIARLVLVAPAALRHGSRFPDVPPERIEAALRAHPDRGLPEALAPELVAAQMQVVGRIWSGSDEEALRTALHGLDVPTLVLYGTLDGLMPPESGREYKRLLPRCTFALVHDSAHEVARDRPEAFADLVSDFLARADAHVVANVNRVINP
ncbi:MAG TPA: alpha/beta fold hydrolase [Solirubrobacteraceae bacterium]|nr:alpha/beta fold hydrolase [Solirubrobacteraceae bacterium]